MRLFHALVEHQRDRLTFTQSLEGIEYHMLRGLIGSHDDQNLPDYLRERVGLRRQQQGRRVEQHQSRRIMAPQERNDIAHACAGEQFGRIGVRPARR